MLLTLLAVSLIAASLVLVILDQAEWVRSNFHWLTGFRLYVILTLITGAVLAVAAYHIASSLIPYVTSNIQSLLDHS